MGGLTRNLGILGLDQERIESSDCAVEGETTQNRMNRNMSAIVCGKRSIFEDLPTTPQVSKRIRCSSSSSSSSPLSSSPVRFSYPRSFFAAASVSSNHHFFASEPQSSLIMEHLRALFPEMDDKVLFF